MSFQQESAEERANLFYLDRSSMPFYLDSNAFSADASKNHINPAIVRVGSRASIVSAIAEHTGDHLFKNSWMDVMPVLIAAAEMVPHFH